MTAYTAHKTFGIGEVTEESGTRVTVYFADEDIEKSMVKGLITFYTSEAEAQIALDKMIEGEIAEADEMNAVLSAPKVDLNEMNHRNAMKNLPSSLR